MTTPNLPPNAPLPSSSPFLPDQAAGACWDVESETRLQAWARGVLGDGDARGAPTSRLRRMARAAISTVVVLAAVLVRAYQALAACRRVAMWTAIAAAAVLIGAFAMFSRPTVSHDIGPDPDFTPIPSATAMDAQAFAQTRPSVEPGPHRRSKP